MLSVNPDFYLGSGLLWTTHKQYLGLSADGQK